MYICSVNVKLFIKIRTQTKELCNMILIIETVAFDKVWALHSLCLLGIEHCIAQWTFR